jgi:peptidoglycan lytic transglycosylase D
MRYIKVRAVKSKAFYFILGVTVTLTAVIISASVSLFNDELTGTKLNPDEQYPQGYRIVTPPIPDQIEFAGERVPIENFEVFERIEREFIVNTYFHSLTILAIKRANRWFPVIEPILKKNNVPDDFKYLGIVESTLENVVSPAGATGFWQIMKAAGKKYGLEINSQIDERYNVEKSTQAASEYLKDAYKTYGTWTMAAASYNMGTNGADNQIERQKTKNYYNLVLNPETSRYIARIVAFKYIMQNSKAYGFDIKDDELYKPLKTFEITLDSSVDDFVDYSIALGLNYKTFKLYNPWLRDNYLSNPNNSVYKIKIPEEGSIKIIN